MFFLLAVTVSLLVSIWLLLRMDIQETHPAERRDAHAGDPKM